MIPIKTIVWTPYGTVYAVMEEATRAWGRALSALGNSKEESLMATDSRNARVCQARISAIISEASEMMEDAVTAGRGKEARVWIDALAEMYRIADTVETAARLAHESSNAPWMPGKADWSEEMKAGDGGARLGKTAEQMTAAPKRSVYVWCDEITGYAKKMAIALGRDDLVIVSPAWLDAEMWRGRRFSGLVVDHAAQLSGSQMAALDVAFGQVRYGTE